MQQSGSPQVRSLRIAVATALAAHAVTFRFDHHRSVTVGVASGHYSGHPPGGTDGGDDGWLFVLACLVSESRFEGQTLFS